jgi:acyl dehydratase
VTRYFEDLEAGARFELGSLPVSRDEIIAFGSQWDPQVFHTDPEGALATQFAGLVASGVHTLAVFVRLFVTGLLADAASLGSPGMDEVRWPAPVRPGDILSATYSVVSARCSASRPTWGIVHGRGELSNQQGQLVLSVTLINMFARAPGESVEGQG